MIDVGSMRKCDVQKTLPVHSIALTGAHMVQEAHKEELSVICKVLADTQCGLLCMQRLQSIAVRISITPDISQEDLIDAQ